MRERVNRMVTLASVLRSRIGQVWLAQSALPEEPAGHTRAAQQLVEQAEQILRAAIESDRALGTSWDDIAAAVGTTPKQVRRRVNDLRVATGIRGPEESSSGQSRPPTAAILSSRPEPHGQSQTSPVRWHGDLPEPLIAALDALMRAIDNDPGRSRSIGVSTHSPGWQLHQWITKIRAAVDAGDAPAVRKRLCRLVTDPMSVGDHFGPAVMDAVRALAKQAFFLLQCPTCLHSPGEHPYDRLTQLDYLNATWLDIAEGQVVERRHCPQCQPTGIPGVSMICDACDEGYFLEKTLASANASGELPPLLIDWLSHRGWRAESGPVVAHGLHGRAVSGPLHQACWLTITGTDRCGSALESHHRAG